jgi:hypothetical protein
MAIRKGLNHQLGPYTFLTSDDEYIVASPPNVTIASSALTSMSTPPSGTNATTFAVSFWRPLSIPYDLEDPGIPSNQTQQTYIWSYSNRPPTPLTSSQTAQFAQHANYGSFNIDFLTAKPIIRNLATWNPETNIASYCVNTRYTFCAEIHFNFIANIATIHLQSTYDGWIAVGLSPTSTMQNASSMYVAWPGVEWGSVVASQRRSVGIGRMPVVVEESEVDFVKIEDDGALIESLGMVRYLETQLEFTFQRPINGTEVTDEIQVGEGGVTRFIWAVSSFGPDPMQPADGPFTQHSFVGAFELDFGQVMSGNNGTTGGVEDVDSTETSNRVMMTTTAKKHKVFAPKFYFESISSGSLSSQRAPKQGGYGYYETTVKIWISLVSVMSMMMFFTR